MSEPVRRSKSSTDLQIQPYPGVIEEAVKRLHFEPFLFLVVVAVSSPRWRSTRSATSTRRCTSSSPSLSWQSSDSAFSY